MRNILVFVLSALISSITFGQSLEEIEILSKENSSKTKGLIVKHDENGNVFVGGQFSGDSISLGGIVHKNNDQIATDSHNGEDFFLSKYNANGNLVWSKSFGGYYDDNICDITLDPLGNIYITGFFRNRNFIIGDYTLSSSSSMYEDVFVAKISSIGEVLWAKKIGGDSYDRGEKIALNKKGEVFVAGTYMSTNFSFGGTTLDNNKRESNNIFLLKLNSSGDPIEAQSLVGEGEEDISNFFIDKKGNLFMTGFTSSTKILFSGQEFNFENKKAKSFVFKMNKKLKLIYFKTLVHKDENDGILSLALSKKGKAYLLVKMHSNELEFSNYKLIKEDGVKESQLHLLKLNAKGKIKQSLFIGGGAQKLDARLLSSHNGDFYVVGSYEGVLKNQVNLALPQAGLFASKLYCIKISKDGTISSGFSIDGASWLNTYGASEFKGDIYLTGNYLSKFNIGDMNYKAASQGSFYLIKTKF